ncbi:MAG: PKD domain-containing protein [Cryomorphaceae bacterium]
MTRLFTLLFATILISSNVLSQRAVCPQDTVKFVLAKATDFDTMSFDPTFTSALYQYFEAPQDISIEGVRFYGFKTDTVGGNSMYLTVEIRNATVDSLPGNTVLASDSVLITVADTSDSLSIFWNYYAHVVDGFNLVVDEPYTVVIKTQTTNPNFSLMHNELDEVSGGGDGNEEWLSGAFQGTGWVKSNVFAPTGVPFDADFFFEPIVQYDMNASFINDPECLFDELGDTVHFFNEATISENRMYNRFAFYGFPDSQIWNFGDGSPVYPVVNPAHFYPTNGPYAATLTTRILSWTQQLCVSPVTQIIKEKPKQDFNYVTNNLEVTFKNKTQGQFSNIKYTFGDGNYSFNADPKHKYAKPGTYWVCQTMMTSCGEVTHCENVAVATNTALNCGKDSVRYTAARGTNVRQLKLQGQGTGQRRIGLGQRFDAPQSMIVHGFTFYANHEGLFKDSYEVICRIYDRSGANVPDTALGPLAESRVHINKIEVDSNYSDSVRYTAIFNKAVNIKSGDDFILTIEYDGAVPVWISTTDWVSGDGDGDLLAVAKIASSSGDTIWYTPGSVFAFNCNGAACDMDVIIEPLIEYNLDANFEYPFECLKFDENGNKLVEFDDLSSRIARSEIYNSRVFYGSILSAYEWDFGDSTGISNQVNALHVFQEPGPFDVTLTVFVDGWTVDCESSQTLNVPVAPTGGFGYDQILSAVQFIDSSHNADEYHWTFSDSTISTLSNPIHYFPRVGTFEVCQYVSNVCGSDTTCEEIVINVMGLPEEYMEHIAIYPNPAKDYIHIDADVAAFGSLEVQLKDFTGRTVKSFSSTDAYARSTWYVGDLASGAYLIEIKMGQYSGTRKFILSH